MKNERAQDHAGRTPDPETDWTGEHERRKRDWSEKERRSRKERRHPAPGDFEDPASAAWRFRA